ncbi:MAG: hypothetical protein ACLTSZ_16755 [Lachnospiraceae bacterium]
MNIRRKYRCFVCCLLVSGICLLGFSVWHLLCSRIPDTMTVSGYGEIPKLFSEPVAQWISGEVTVKTVKPGRQQWRPQPVKRPATAMPTEKAQAEISMKLNTPCLAKFH